MRDQLEQRLDGLQSELELGQRALGDVERRRDEMRIMMLRIAGAIAVLEEELEKIADVQPQDGMPSAVNDRLDQLRTEMRAGEQALGDLGVQRADLGDAVLQLSGAIQIIKELLDDAVQQTEDATRD